MVSIINGRVELGRNKTVTNCTFRGCGSMKTEPDRPNRGKVVMGNSKMAAASAEPSLLIGSSLCVLLPHHSRKREDEIEKEEKFS